MVDGIGPWTFTDWPAQLLRWFTGGNSEILQRAFSWKTFWSSCEGLWIRSLLDYFWGLLTFKPELLQSLWFRDLLWTFSSGPFWGPLVQRPSTMSSFWTLCSVFHSLSLPSLSDSIGRVLALQCVTAGSILIQFRCILGQGRDLKWGCCQTGNKTSGLPMCPWPQDPFSFSSLFRCDTEYFHMGISRS